MSTATVAAKKRPAARARTAPRGAKGKAAKPPDMKAWAALALARLKAQYGNRVTPDSTALFEDMRADKF